MRVAYFSNHLGATQGYGGGRFALEQLHALRSLPQGPSIVPVAAWSDLGEVELERRCADLGLRTLRSGRRATPVAWTFLRRPTIESLLRDPIDVVHSISLGYPVATRKPLVVTIHDIGPLTHPEFFSNTPTWLARRSLARAVQHAAAIICISEATADEIVSFAHLHFDTEVADRLHVISPGIDADRLRLKLGLDPVPGLVDGTPFLLAAGKISPRKNVQGVIQALGHLADVIPHHLVVVGGDGWEVDEIKRTATATGVSGRVHFAGYVGHDQLVALYHAAAAYVHPSLFEGFGLTVLEAMAAGCPVVTSDRSSLPEVAGDAALLVDPTNPLAIAEAIHTICRDEAAAAELRRRGHARVDEFSWPTAAANVAAIYRSVA